MLDNLDCTRRGEVFLQAQRLPISCAGQRPASAGTVELERFPSSEFSGPRTYVHIGELFQALLVGTDRPNLATVNINQPVPIVRAACEEILVFTDDEMVLVLPASNDVDQ